MTHWNVAGALHNPNGMTPELVMSLMCLEGRFGLIGWQHTDLMVACS
jgi:hypothetical protein